MSFEDVMMKRLASCHAEACKEILAGVKSGRSLSDAVSDTIEALPTSKTRELRRWLQDWEAWEEWQTFKRGGYKARRSGPHVFLSTPLLEMPPLSELLKKSSGLPSVEAIAAGAGVQAIEYETDSNAVPERYRPEYRGPKTKTWTVQYRVVRGAS